jgi:hypothetical protein
MSVLLITVISLHGWGQSKPQDRFPLAAHQVAQSLSVNGIQIADQQVTLLANVVATEPNPALDVLSVVPLGGRFPGKASGAHSLVKLACRLPARCLPFYAIVGSPEGTTAGASSPLNARAGSAAGELRPSALITIRAGVHATMLMDDDRAHIQVAVVCLENGIAGHRIHVASPDHKQIYVAEVVSANLLKRSF